MNTHSATSDELVCCIPKGPPDKSWESEIGEEAVGCPILSSLLPPSHGYSSLRSFLLGSGDRDSERL